jgi:hypothetical protein
VRNFDPAEVQDFDWEHDLLASHGAPDRLGGLLVFHEVRWEDLTGGVPVQFRHGKNLAARVRRECPENLTPALLLLNRDHEGPRHFTSASKYVVVLNLDQYLEIAVPDASAGFFSRDLESGLIGIDDVQAAMGDLDANESNTVIRNVLRVEHVRDWIEENQDQLEEIRAIVGDTSEVERTAYEGELLTPERAEEIRSLLMADDLDQVLEFLRSNQVVPDGVARGVEYARRCGAVVEFRDMLDQNLTEDPWQQWFTENRWVLGSEFVQILDRRVDVTHTLDFLAESLDGFVDIVEIKRPGGNLEFWSSQRDHGNLVPHTELVKAITQCCRYQVEVERRNNDSSYIQRIGARVLKPRSVLIFGRSNEWGPDEREAFRILNASYHSLMVMTYDQVLFRAERTLGLVDPDGTGSVLDS